MEDSNKDEKLVPMHIQWHKICALLIFKMNGHQLITAIDIKEMEKKWPNGAVLVHDMKDGLHLDLIGYDQAKKLVENAPAENCDFTPADETAPPSVTGDSDGKIADLG